jgi:hypothetical protein
MNLKVLKRSRRVRAGDIFVYQLIQEPDYYRFGRVICTDANAMTTGPDKDVLIYLYRASASAKENIPVLDPHELLVDPLMTNRRPWTMGYFEKVAQRDLQPGDTLAQHCFADGFRQKIFDEKGEELTNPKPPFYVRRLTSVIGINRRISDELGYPVDETAYQDRD